VTVPPVVWIVSALVAIEFVVVVLVCRALVGSTFGELARAHPPVTPGPNVETRGFQSLSFGIVNLGWCVHVDADERWVHLRPAWIARRMGMSAVSLPRDQIVVEKTRWSKAFVKVGTLSLTGPKWCLAPGPRDDG
jgi:hypothetical protein